MYKIYGYSWTRQYGEADDGTWLRGLAGLTESEIRKGIEACIFDRADKWPPGLPEFRAMCKPPQRENEPMYRYPTQLLLPKKLSDEERQAGRQAIADAKEAIKWT